MMDLELGIEHVLQRAVKDQKNFDHIASGVRSIFNDTDVNSQDQEKILKNLKDLIKNYNSK